MGRDIGFYAQVAAAKQKDAERKARERSANKAVLARYIEDCEENNREFIDYAYVEPANPFLARDKEGFW